MARPPRPSEVEAIRSRLSLRDATLVSLLAYAGLRPGEALALRWRDVSGRSVVIERSVSLGRERATKTKATRGVGLLRPLAQALAAYPRARDHAARVGARARRAAESLLCRRCRRANAGVRPPADDA
jgi:integrase